MITECYGIYSQDSVRLLGGELASFLQSSVDV